MRRNSTLFTLYLRAKLIQRFCTVLIIFGELCDVTVHFVSWTAGVIEEGFNSIVHLCHLFTSHIL